MTEQTRDSALIDQAGEYVLGTLQGEARDAFARRLERDVALQRQVAEWERRLAPLMETIEPVQPPEAVWRALERRLDPQPLHPSNGGLWNSLNFWRGFGMVAATLMLALGLTLFGVKQESTDLQQVMVVLNDRSQTGWLVGKPQGEGVLRVSAVQPTRLPADKVCQLWLQTEDGRMLPLGVLPHEGSIELHVPAPMQHYNRFKVSIESATLAPVEQPSGEIVFEGELTPI